MGPTRPSRGSVLIAEDDRDLAWTVTMLLAGEGFDVHSIDRVEGPAVLDAVDRLDPDCLLLDSEPGPDYGRSWELARRLHERARPLPVIMFTAHARAVEEATENLSARSRAAHLAGVIPKPFEMGELIEAVAGAIGGSARTPAAANPRRGPRPMNGQP